MPTIRIKLRTPARELGPRGGLTITRPGRDDYDEVDLDELSPRARALAQAVAHCPHATAGTIRLRSTQTVRDLHPPHVVEAYYTPEQADRPLTMDWDAWDKYPVTSTTPAAEWLERQAAKIPPGWRIVGATPSPLGGEPHIQVDDSSTLMTAQQIVAYIATKGRHMTAPSWRSKVSHGHAPKAADRVGRTPLWEQADVEAWLDGTWRATEGEA